MGEATVTSHRVAPLCSANPAASLRLYLAVAKLPFARHLTYRAANLAGLATNSSFGVMRAYLFIGLYAGKPLQSGWSLDDALAFVWIAQALIMPVYLFHWTDIALTYGGTKLTSYPLPIYHELMQRFFIYIVPLAFVTYFPSLYLLDRPESRDWPAWLPFVSPLAAALLALAARFAWGFGVRHYRSTGS